MDSNLPLTDPSSITTTLYPEQLQYLQSEAMLQRRSEKATHFGWGFWLIIMALVLGIAWWLLPQFLFSCGGRAKESEGRMMIGTIGRGQQAFFLEHNRFSPNFAALGLGVEAITKNYAYSSMVQGDRVFNYAVAQGDISQSYVGAVFVLESATQETAAEAESFAFATVTCAVNISKNQVPVELNTVLPFLDNNIPQCHPKTNLMMRSPHPSEITPMINTN